jgi:polysaccharide biosynthesis/export protein
MRWLLLPETLRMRRNIGLLLFLAMLLATGCTINKDIMFKTPVDYTFDQLPDSLDPAFRIQANDFLQFRLFANDGFRMIDMVSQEGGVNQMQANRMTMTYPVEYDGLVKLPLLGRVRLAGLTLREAELFLEEKYAEFYNRPFAQLVIGNRRVVVYPGTGGSARVVPLDNNNTTLTEVIAQAGGLTTRGRADRIKLFRRLPGQPQRLVYEFDMSTIEGLRFGDTVMQGDDIVYVEPNPELLREVLFDITPLVTLLTSMVLVIGLVNNLQR